ncbi:hypothetical protein ACIRPK_24700 [Kitasatospora sp. NPDC101801]|uniref:hypothetical protein n=1 Tax=Kitasatospora sp. NPDC101801 TaxID=3364103 RepID=UPI0037F25056
MTRRNVYACASTGETGVDVLVVRQPGRSENITVCRRDRRGQVLLGTVTAAALVIRLRT